MMSPATPLHFPDGYMIAEWLLYYHTKVEIGIGDALHDNVVLLGRRV